MKRFAILLTGLIAMVAIPTSTAEAQVRVRLSTGAYGKPSTTCPSSRPGCRPKTRAYRGNPRARARTVVTVCASRACRPCRRFVRNKRRGQRVAVAKRCGEPARVVVRQPQVVVRASATPARRTPVRATSTRPLAPQLVAALVKNDLLAACRLASWADGDVKRQEALRRAVFMQLPSPSVIESALAELRAGAGWRGLPGRDTLVRVLEGARARPR